MRIYGVSCRLLNAFSIAAYFFLTLGISTSKHACKHPLNLYRYAAYGISRLS